MATPAPLDEPTTTAGWCLSNSAWAILTASLKSSSGNFGLITSWPCRARKVGLTPTGTDCQPWRKRTFIAYTSSFQQHQQHDHGCLRLDAVAQAGGHVDPGAFCLAYLLHDLEHGRLSGEPGPLEI